MHLWWTCPNCGSKVDFTEELIDTCFDVENGEAHFEPETGIFFHTIFCHKCEASWVMSIGGISKEFVKNK